MGGGEHDIGDADQRDADQQVRDRQGTGHDGCRYAQDHQGPDHVRRDHQASQAKPVDPDTNRDAQDQEGTQAQRVDESHLQGAGTEHRDSNDRDHDAACFVARALERAGNPQFPELNQPHQRCLDRRPAPGVDNRL